MKYNPCRVKCIICELSMYCAYDSYEDRCPKGEKEDKDVLTLCSTKNPHPITTSGRWNRNEMFKRIMS